MKKEIFVLIFLPALSLGLYFSSLIVQMPHKEVLLRKNMGRIAYQACVCFFIQKRNQIDCINTTRQPAVSALVIFDSNIERATVSFSNWTSIAQYKNGLCELTQD